MPKTTSVAVKPDVICIGEVGEVGELKEPREGGRYHSFAIGLNPYQNGQKATVFFRFWPEAFAKNFDPKSIEPDFGMKKGESAENDEKRSRHFVHTLNIGSEAGDAFLQVLVGDKWDEYNTVLENQETSADGLDSEKIRQITAQFIAAKPVIYRLAQQTRPNEQGERVRQDRYEVKSLFAVNDANLKRFRKENFVNAKRPTIVTFEVEEDETAAA
jgi:hypothetical protein